MSGEVLKAPGMAAAERPYVLNAIDNQRHLAASEIEWVDALIQTTREDYDPLEKNGTVASMVIAVAALAFARGPRPGSEPPKLHGETLDGKAIVLPDAAAGKVTLLLLGASKKGGERTDPWKDHFVADFGSNRHTSCYVAASLQSVPSVFRGMIRVGMRGGTPDAARSHVLTSRLGMKPHGRHISISVTTPCPAFFCSTAWGITGGATMASLTRSAMKL
jgi:hypothetical protein